MLPMIKHKKICHDVDDKYSSSCGYYIIILGNIYYLIKFTLLNLQLPGYVCPREGCPVDRCLEDRFQGDRILINRYQIYW